MSQLGPIPRRVSYSYACIYSAQKKDWLQLTTPFVLLSVFLSSQTDQEREGEGEREREIWDQKRLERKAEEERRWEIAGHWGS